MIAPVNRPYAGPDDLAAIVELLTEVRAEERLDRHPSPASLEELVTVPAQREGLRLWFDAAGRLAGFVLVDARYCNFYFELRPGEDGLLAAMIAWANAYLPSARQARSLPVDDLTLDSPCHADDRRRRALLETHGFEQLPDRSVRMVRALDDPIATPTVPVGFRIRPTTGEGEVEALVALHQATFETEHISVGDRLSWMRTPDYDPNLDLVAVGPDGRLAAYCFCAIYGADNARTGRRDGFTDPVATHPDFRRRGLARALLLTGLTLLRERGMDRAVLGTLAENAAMLHAARSVGFVVQWETLWFARALGSVPQSRP